MIQSNVHAVTGAFGFSGQYIARRLLAKGHSVITLTNSTRRSHSLGEVILALPFNFGSLEALTESLRGVSVLYNTYWVRFNHSLFTHSDAVQNTLTLFEAAKAAGVKRIVHVSITNPDENSPLEYFSGKGKLEKALMDTGISYAILRPAVLFGKEDVLINNIAWGLRHFPVFGIFGDGQYRLQPIFVEDLAALAVEQGERSESVIINAIGPESFTYKELVQTVGTIIGKKRPIISLPPAIAYMATWLAGKLVGDMIITREEIKGLMQEFLHVDAPPAGNTKLTEWIKDHAATVGNKYINELARRKDRVSGYIANG